MDFEENDNLSQSPEPIPDPAQNQPATKPRKKRTGWRIFWGIVLAMSVLANILLFVVLIGVVAVFATGQRGVFTEEVIKEGPRTAKIAVIDVEGIIDDKQARDVWSQLKSARKDKWVKGLIIRVNSPGGLVSSSDQIYNELLKYRSETGKPVVAFMRGIAASGGYYTSVGCDKIIAEPTVITGSVGVIMGYLVLQELLEEKLGIQPIIEKSGLKKDWPSSFQMPTEEQRQYLQDKLIKPAYERFVQVVADGRGELSLDEVKALADGSIYSTAEALEEKMIDGIGYIDDAIEMVLAMAEIEKAQVVEYRKPFSFSDFITSRGKNALGIDREALYELASPRLLYLWNGY